MELFKGIVHNTSELGQLIRSERKASGITLQQTSARSNIGIRFLSELERGKPTAEIGKVISALQTVGLDLAVIQKPENYQSNSSTTDSVKESIKTYHGKTGNNLSDQLGLEFPYEWSDPNINETGFIRLVLVKARFNDVLRITHHFGIKQVEAEVESLNETPQYDLVKKLLSHIRSGIKIAESKT